MRIALLRAKTIIKIIFAAFGMVVLLVLVVLAIADSGILSPFPDTEITQQKPFADFIGREYRVISTVSAYAWNDFPDKDKIRTITLDPPPGTRNRFVSWVAPLKLGQLVRLTSAWQHTTISGPSRYYVVSVPGAELPEGIKIALDVESDGVPNPHIYESVPQSAGR